MEWEADMKTYLKDLEKTKPVIFCGDLNVAHEEIGKLIKCEAAAIYQGNEMRNIICKKEKK